MSHIQSIYHIVVSTKNRDMSINPEQSRRLYAYCTTQLNSKGCHVYAINGIPNHIHILVDLPTTACLADVMRDFKRSTSLWMRTSGYFPVFRGWGKEYGAFSVSFIQKDAVAGYIFGQQEHHSKLAFEEEYERLVLRNGLQLHKTLL